MSCCLECNGGCIKRGECECHAEFNARMERKLAGQIDANPSPLAMTTDQLRARVRELEALLMERGQAVRNAESNEERWRRDAVEDKPAREVLKEVREVLGVKEGEGVVEVAKRMVDLLAEFKDVHVNLRPWIARAEKLMSAK